MLMEVGFFFRWSFLLADLTYYYNLIDTELVACVDNFCPFVTFPRFSITLLGWLGLQLAHNVDKCHTSNSIEPSTSSCVTSWVITLCCEAFLSLALYYLLTHWISCFRRWTEEIKPLCWQNQSSTFGEIQVGNIYCSLSLHARSFLQRKSCRFGTWSLFVKAILILLWCSVSICVSTFPCCNSFCYFSLNR